MPLAGYYSPCDPGETQPYSIDFANQIPVGDSIVSVSSTLSADSGVDPYASNWLVGPPGFVGGTVCAQMIGGALPNGLKAGVTYRLDFTVLTAGGSTLNNYGMIPCVSIS